MKANDHAMATTTTDSLSADLEFSLQEARGQRYRAEQLFGSPDWDDEDLDTGADDIDDDE